jgi:hypothetical protein
MGDLKQGSIPGSSQEWSLNLLQMAMQIHDMPYHARDEKATSLLQDVSTNMRLMAVGGQYLAAAPTLTDGDACALTFTSDGKLRTDASITVGAITVNVSPIIWTLRYYREITVTQVDQTLNFGFNAKQVIVANDDASNSVHINYGGAAAADATHDKVLAGETFEDQFQTSNIHLICPAGLTAVCRVWARADV